jgi:L-lactate utilization protein LutC
MEYDTLASQDTVKKTAAALKEHNFNSVVVANKEEALAKIKETIPAGASVMNGASVTLEQAGYVEYLKSGAHPWHNLHAEVLAEKDPEKQAKMRKHASVSDYYLGSAHAVSETGEIVFGSNSGSQMAHLVYTSPNIILVVGTQKIVPTLSDALKRLEEYVVPLEDKHMLDLYKMHTTYAKTLILHRENPNYKRNITIIFVEEKLGF